MFSLNEADLLDLALSVMNRTFARDQFRLGVADGERQIWLIGYA
jgi:hypothetical protein